MELLGVRVDNFRKVEVLNIIQSWLYLSSELKHQIITLNPEFILAAQGDEEFKNIINNSSLVIADGIGVLWAAKFLSLKTIKIKVLRPFQIAFQTTYTLLSLIFYPKYCKVSTCDKITGVDLFLDIIDFAAKNNKSVFLLGGLQGVGKIVTVNLKNKYPELKIVGTYEGNPSAQEEVGIKNLINKVKPDILMVAYGQVRQEKWIARNLGDLPSVKIAMGVGGTFDFVSNKIKRAPLWMRQLGLEWLFRLIQEPRRLGRIVNATVVFACLIAKRKVRC